LKHLFIRDKQQASTPTIRAGINYFDQNVYKMTDDEIRESSKPCSVDRVCRF